MTWPGLLTWLLRPSHRRKRTVAAEGSEAGEPLLLPHHHHHHHHQQRYYHQQRQLPQEQEHLQQNLSFSSLPDPVHELNESAPGESATFQPAFLTAAPSTFATAASLHHQHHPYFYPVQVAQLEANRQSQLQVSTHFAERSLATRRPAGPSDHPSPSGITSSAAATHHPATTPAAPLTSERTYERAPILHPTSTNLPDASTTSVQRLSPAATMKMAMEAQRRKGPARGEAPTNVSSTTAAVAATRGGWVGMGAFGRRWMAACIDGSLHGATPLAHGTSLSYRMRQEAVAPLTPSVAERYPREPRPPLDEHTPALKACSTEHLGRRTISSTRAGGGGGPSGPTGSGVLLDGGSTAASAMPFDPRNPRRVVHISRDGTPSIVRVDRHQLVADMGIAYRDLRAIDPALPIPTPTAILIRERALVVNLETVRLIVGADQVYVLSVQHPLDRDGRLPGGYGGYDAFGGGSGGALSGRTVDCVQHRPLQCQFIRGLCARLSAANEPTAIRLAAAAAAAAAVAERAPPDTNPSVTSLQDKGVQPAEPPELTVTSLPPPPLDISPYGNIPIGINVEESGSPFRTPSGGRGGGTAAADETAAAAAAPGGATALLTGPSMANTATTSSLDHQHHLRHFLFPQHSQQHPNQHRRHGGGSVGDVSARTIRQSTLHARRSAALAAAWGAEQARREAAAVAAAVREDTTVGGGESSILSDVNGVGGAGGGRLASSRTPPPLPPTSPSLPQHPPLRISTITTAPGLPTLHYTPAGGVGGRHKASVYPPPPVPPPLSPSPPPPAGAPDASGDGNGGPLARIDVDAIMLDLELPYELCALEAGLYEAVRLLDAQVCWLERYVPRAADDLARGVTPARLERVREAKRAIKAVGGRCRRLAATLRGILDDDDDMLDMYIGRRAELEGEQPDQWHLPAALRHPASSVSDEDDEGADNGDGGGAVAATNSIPPAPTVTRPLTDGSTEVQEEYGGLETSAADVEAPRAWQPTTSPPYPQPSLTYASGSGPPPPPTSSTRTAIATPFAELSQQTAEGPTRGMVALPLPGGTAQPVTHAGSSAAAATAATAAYPASEMSAAAPNAGGPAAGGGDGNWWYFRNGSPPARLVDVQVPEHLAMSPLPLAPNGHTRPPAPHHRHHPPHSRTSDHSAHAGDAARRHRTIPVRHGTHSRSRALSMSPSTSTDGPAVQLSDRSEDGSSGSRSGSDSMASVATTEWAAQQAAATAGGGTGVVRATPHDVEDCENLLEFYYVQAEALLGRLDALNERIDDTEDYVNIDLDNRRNQIVGIDLIVTSITLMFTFVTSVAGIFGMNMRNTLEESFEAFWVTTLASGLVGLGMCCAFLGYVARNRLLMLGGGGGGGGGWGAVGGGGGGAEGLRGDGDEIESRDDSGIWGWGVNERKRL